MKIYDNNSLHSSWNENVSKLCRQHVFCVQWPLFQISCLLWAHVEIYGRAWQAMGDNIIQEGMRFASWITKATDTCLECIKLIAFPQQQWLSEHTSLFLYSYIAGLVNLASRCWWLVNFGAGLFTLGKIAPNDDRTGGWVVEAIWQTEERKFSYSYWKSNHEFLVDHLVLHSLLLRSVLSMLLNTFIGSRFFSPTNAPFY